ncbi:hypothetical protein ACFVMC_22515 [Nocardia sp. NPDC127579]|uniref:hypothetical protein n=1 Tax=Nocardia sp. NPDC127579 TaxID=3345402 RepID=UPI0036283A8F
MSTPSEDAQIWFDRGLVWSYAFNHEASAACFERAVAVDSNCAIAYWGIAYALGPNYNKPWEFFDEEDLTTTVEKTHRAMGNARKHIGSASPVEQALIEALEARFPVARVASAADCSVWNVDYADRMRDVYARFPDDLDVATLFADALMNLTPWQLWDLRTGEPAPGAATVEAKAVLDHALTLPGALEHPGMLHMYIHLMEMSGTPEQALTIADHLRGLVPDAGHLHHMPSHLDVLCGDYRRVVAANADAVAADEKYLDREGPMNFYTLYRSHDYHFKIYGAMFLGRSAVAIETAERLSASIPEDLLRVAVPPMADWLEGFLSAKAHALIRFGRWQDIIDEPLPADPELYCVTTAMLHYAKGVAYSATNQVLEAEREQAEFAAAYARVLPSRTLFNNTCRDILAVAEAMLEGELEYRKGNYDIAFAALERAIALDDNLPYDEPWGWMQPTRHAYAALLMEQGRIEEAAEVYRADLGLDDSLPRSQQHPGNVWSLHGFHECLLELGRTAEAAIIGQQLDMAVAYADIPIEASCFCRLTAVSCHSGDTTAAAAAQTGCCDETNQP